ncbi:MAG: hypothetical protein AMS27_16375 [Bacteroides sp. SM23_62_1]|nr:MAG: hypothetical protein AMS27_16375 [Bacteroides sp. SM23_62_1]
MKIVLVILGLTAIFSYNNAIAIEIWVSTSGSDRNPGTKEQPMKTLLMAMRKARELRRLNDPAVKEGVHIILGGGVYRLYEPVLIRPEDSGSESSPTIIRAASGEKPVLSGGKTVGNWEKVMENIERLPGEAQGRVWATDIPSIWSNQLNFRQLWVNGRKADRASSFNDGELNRIIKSDSLKEEMWIPVPEIPLQNSVQLEFIILQWWTIANLRVKTFDIIGDKARLTFHQPESRIEFEHPWPMPVDDSADIYMADDKYPFCGNSPFFFANTIELLNQPGEWCRDPVTGMIYYWPRENEDMSEAEVIIPFLETVIRIEGSLDNPVSNIIFQGLGFEHTTWMRPSEAGHVPVQDGMYFIDAYKLKVPGTPGNETLENQGWLGRQSAGISVHGASHIRFERCIFSHMSATALDFISGTNHINVEGCVFSDIGGSGVRIGFYGDLSTEDHIPYDPVDFREVCHHIRIANNLITDCSNEYWGCDGINVGFAHDINIEHNEVSHLNNSGISVGWGWTGTINCMKNNRIHANNIHHFARQLYDVAGIYVLSAQPNTEISNNSIHHIEKAPYAHLRDHYQYIYLDQNSSYIRVINNWTEQARFNANTKGPGNEWINNGPHVSEEIKNKAGLETEYKNLLKLTE